jgi:spore germination protein YaaH
MNKNKLTKYLAIGILVSVAGYFIGNYLWYNPIFFEQRTPKRFFWISGMFMGDSIPIIEENHAKIDFISPTWYGLDENAQLYNIYENISESAALMNQINALGIAYTIPIHPLISTDKIELLYQILKSETLQDDFILKLNVDAKRYGFTGFNIDFEGLDASYRDLFTDFYRNIRSGLEAEYELSIAVPAKQSDTKTGWDGWCDYAALGKVSDMFMLMTYDLHGGWSEPGEVASTSWVKRVLAYTTRAVALEKIYAGIPLYGYDWSDNPEWENWGFGYAHFEHALLTYNGQTTRTDDGYEIRLEYADAQGYPHLAYYCDAETSIQKEKFFSSYPIGGYCYWHLSCGDPSYWDRV